MEKFIIIDLFTRKALHGRDNVTLRFDTEKEAINLADQMFEMSDSYFIVPIIWKGKK